MFGLHLFRIITTRARPIYHDRRESDKGSAKVMLRCYYGVYTLCLLAFVSLVVSKRSGRRPDNAAGRASPLPMRRRGV